MALATVGILTKIVFEESPISITYDKSRWACMGRNSYGVTKFFRQIFIESTLGSISGIFIKNRHVL
jgi:hypothetical protein